MTPTPVHDLDVVLWGATGFTGRLVADHLVARHGVDDGLRWAIGGRNEVKLEALRDELGADVPIVLGDAADPDSLRAMAEATRVVCTTVGPYARHGSELVAACVETGTDCCDLTGEIQWIRRMIDQHHQRAAATGARIVHCCGFDCIPTDLGTWFTQQQMIERHGTPSPHVSIRVAGGFGGVSGGTLASMMALLGEASHDDAVRALLEDPYALNPDGERHGGDGPDPKAATRDDDGNWTSPWLMTIVDGPVVRRSHALLGRPWGEDFRLDERLRIGRGPTARLGATLVATAMTVGRRGGSIGLVRRAMGSFTPKPGSGPSPRVQQMGFFDIRFHARDAGGEVVLRTRVKGDRDPGYGSTAKMLGEAAACLALDDLDVGGGVLTPAAAMGEALVERLNRHAGVTFSVDE